MDYHSAGRRSFYGKLFNFPRSGDPGSQRSLNPIFPSPTEPALIDSVYTVPDAREKGFEYQGIDLKDLNNLDSPSPFDQPLEQPKPANQHRIWTAWYRLLPHVIASAVTVAVVQLSFRDQYWMDLVDPNVDILPGITQGGALNALQLAAKFHELLLVASLGTIVMHVAQAHMVGRRGLPLGLIANSFSIGTGDYLRTRAFWSSTWTGRSHYWRFWLLSILASMLAIVAGPASAIAIIPSLNWFPVHKPFDNSVLPFYIFNQSTVLWPQTLTSASLNAPDSGIDCVAATTSTLSQDSCPAGGFRDNYQWSGDLLFTNSSAGSNISFSDARGDTRRILSTQSCASDFDGRASGMSLNTFITGAMTAYWTFAQNNFGGLALTASQPRLSLKASIFAPRVEVMCNGNDYYNLSQVESRAHVNFPSFTPGRELPSASYILPYKSTLNDTTFDWVEMPSGSDSPSIGVAVRVPWIYSLKNETRLRQATEIHACSIYAQWVPVDVHYQPRTSDQVDFNIKGKLTDTCLSLPTGSDGDQAVRNVTIGLDYANAINQNVSFVDGPIPAIVAMLNQAVFQDTRVTGEVANAFKSPFVGSARAGQNTNLTTDDVRKSRATMISTLLAGAITDGLARVAGNGLFPYSASMFLTNETDNGNIVGRFLVSTAQGGEDETLNATSANVGEWLRVDPVFSRYGYGYQWSDSTTLQFGVVVLLINLAVAIAHTLFIVYKVFIKGEALVSSWNTVSELLVLAMNSTPSPRLRDASAGMQTGKTWRQVVTVRETYPSHLEMVVGPEDKDRHSLQGGEGYGHLGSMGAP